MPVQDIRSDLKVSQAGVLAISANGDNNGAIIDNADYELGAFFVTNVVSYTDGDHEIKVFESDAADMSGESEVVGDKLLQDPLVLSAANASGDSLPRVGYFSTKRYTRVTSSSTGVTTGATVSLFAVQKAEYMPEEG